MNSRFSSTVDREVTSPHVGYAVMEHNEDDGVFGKQFLASAEAIGPLCVATTRGWHYCTDLPIWCIYTHFRTAFQ